jgi:hypothetical protein
MIKCKETFIEEIRVGKLFSDIYEEIINVLLYKIE